MMKLSLIAGESRGLMGGGVSVLYRGPPQGMRSMSLEERLLSTDALCQDNLRAWLMAGLQAQTKLSSSEPGVCPPDLRGAATANKTHKDPRPWHRPSPRLPAILPPPPHPHPHPQLTAA
ncbi:hypothetical protein NQZ68_022627 [Dissostichus eleginoides]|nr:hypothetical protein NQZ68_022627 [Dissostichus eleginoides]